VHVEVEVNGKEQVRLMTLYPTGGRQLRQKERNCLHLFVPAKNRFPVDSTIINCMCHTPSIQSAGWEQWLLWHISVKLLSVKMSKASDHGEINDAG